MKFKTFIPVLLGLATFAFAVPSSYGTEVSSPCTDIVNGCKDCKDDNMCSVSKNLISQSFVSCCENWDQFGDCHRTTSKYSIYNCELYCTYQVLPFPIHKTVQCTERQVVSTGEICVSGCIRQPVIQETVVN